MPKKEKIELTQQIANELLRYDEESGILFWKKREIKWFVDRRAMNVWNTRYADKPALNCIHEKGNGYRHGDILGIKYLAHRVIWFMLYGEWPITIDHKNRIRSDNRLCNLQNVTYSENNFNIGLRPQNTSGVVGVSYSKRGVWKVSFGNRHVGQSKSFAVACEMRKKAEEEYENQ